MQLFSRSFFSLAASLSVLAVGIGGPHPASAGLSPITKAEIVDLMLCYGLGTDAIGDSTRADPEGDGAAIYASCFTDDAVFRAWFPGTDFSDPTQAVTVGPTATQTGPEAWAEFVFGVFNGTYTFTQHTLTNFMVRVKGSSGTLTALLNAAHVTQVEGAVTQVDVAHGKYTLKVVKIKGRWKIRQLDLTLIDFVPFFP